MTALEQLRALEASGNYCFHGSPVMGLNKIKRRSYHRTQKSRVLFASPLVWVACCSTFRWSGADFDQGIVNGVPYFHAQHDKAWDRLGNEGCVYVLDRHHFFEWPSLASFERIAFRDVKPIHAIRVTITRSDLSELGVRI